MFAQTFHRYNPPLYNTDENYTKSLSHTIQWGTYSRTEIPLE